MTLPRWTQLPAKLTETAAGTAQRKSLSQMLLDVCSATVFQEMLPSLLKHRLFFAMFLCLPFCTHVFKIFLLLIGDGTLKVAIAWT